MESKTLAWECAQLTDEHITIAWQWRNDPVSRRFSFHQEPISYDDFARRYQCEYSVWPDLPPLFAIHAGERCAFLFFEPAEHPHHPKRRCCMLSINVAPEWRGKGIGSQILAQIQPWLDQRGYDTVIAEVRVDNTASSRAFTNAGFKVIEQLWHHVEDTNERVEVLLYSVELTPKYLFPADVYIIAEAGSNWRMGSYERDKAMAKTLIETAAAAGANAIKFQTYRASTVYVSNAGSSEYLNEAGIKEDVTSLFEDLSMPYEMLPELAAYSRQCGIDFLSTAFSVEDFQQVDPHVPLHKIASYEIGHPHLLACAAQSGKPLLLSTGAATPQEIDWAVNYYHSQGGKQLILLQCTAAYPAPLDQLNLKALSWLKARYKVQVGLSDHSEHPYYAPAAAVALGAVVIEKHFTLSRSLPGPDHFFAVTPEELHQLVQSVRSTYVALGNPVKSVCAGEQELRSFAKRGVQALRAILVGESLVEGDNVAILRPGLQPLGMPPRYLAQLAGRRFIRPVEQGHGVQLADLEGNYDFSH
jgi:sialic acid synthase SpsE/ribosomal protein S18 acetylase RimI-like enzyme